MYVPPPALAPVLTPVALLYGGVLRLRNAYYDRPGAARRAALPVISVGNITVGGTGKTPLVIELARRLHQSGRRPAVLTRGYKAAPGQTADEVLELQDALPDVPVVVNRDRVAGAAAARQEHRADCVLLDDGFQHRRLARDLDMVLIDALDPQGGGQMLPVGRLREPLIGLRRADVFVITRANQITPERLAEITTWLTAYRTHQPVLEARVEPRGVHLPDGTLQPPEFLHSKRVLAVSGVGNPASFEALVRGLGATATLHRYPDHHAYTSADATDLLNMLPEAPELVVTTRKDWVKLSRVWPAEAPPLVRLDIRLALAGEIEGFEARLRKVLERKR